MPSSGRSELDLIQLYALVLHLLVLNSFILIQFIHLNASISSVIVYLYTSSILYTYALVCIYLFKPEQFHALGAHIYASSGQLQIPQIHTYGGIMGHHLHLYTYTRIHLWGIIYNYALTRIHNIHVYNTTNWNLNTALCNAHCACDTCMCHHQIPQIRTYGATVYVLK